MRWVVTCARGLEEITAAELAGLGIEPIARETGGVVFTGDWSAGLRANWRLRSANRVLIELASWPAPDDESLYQGARRLVVAGGLPSFPESLYEPSRTFAVVATSSASRIRDTRWIALKVKDGIVDGQRERWGRRASIDREQPDLQLRLRLLRDRATLLVDTSGEPLDHRGYRVMSTAAPLREQIAAAAVLASGWDGRGPVVDPMCGSGTLLAEAGALALGLAPNRLRQHWAFERLPGFDPDLWLRVRGEALPVPGPDCQLHGIDLSAEAMNASRRNLAAAGLLERSTLVSGDAFETQPPGGPGLLIANPPHGTRLLDTPELWRRLGDLLKRSYRGWKVVLVAGGEGLGKELGLKPTRRIPAWSGKLEMRLLVLDLW